MQQIDLNCDLGESYGPYLMGQDHLLLDIVTSANIACGYHAGDHNVMNRTMKWAKEKQVGIGAHPGLPDLMGFGRREMQVTAEEVYNMLIYQLGAISGFSQIYNVQLQHVKPHGALYNTASVDPMIAASIAQAVYDFDSSLILFGLAGSQLIKAGQQVGLRVAEEVFADRTYLGDGTLTPRTHPQALIKDVHHAVERMVHMINNGVVEALDGTQLSIRADTICVHGDNEQALLFTKELRSKLIHSGLTLQRVGKRTEQVCDTR